MMFQKFKKFFADEYNHIVLRKLEQIQYELQHEVDDLERLYNESKNDIIWTQLELKREELTNVSARLADRRMKTIKG